MTLKKLARLLNHSNIFVLVFISTLTAAPLARAAADNHSEPSGAASTAIVSPSVQPEAFKTSIHFMTGIEDHILKAEEGEAAPEPRTEDPDPIVMTYEKCTRSTEGSTCEWKYSNGFNSTEEKKTVTRGDVTEIRTLLTEKDPAESLTARREILQTIKRKNGRKTSESYDITYRFSRGSAGMEETLPQMREVLRYFYTPGDDGKDKLRDMSWTKYNASANGSDAVSNIDYHAVLSYDENGQPRKGFADRWENGRKSKNLFFWQPELGAIGAGSRDQWNMWGSWIRTGFLHVYLV